MQINKSARTKTASGCSVVGVVLRVEKEDEVGVDCGGVCRAVVSVVPKLPEDLMARTSGCYSPVDPNFYRPVATVPAIFESPPSRALCVFNSASTHFLAALRPYCRSPFAVRLAMIA